MSSKSSKYKSYESALLKAIVASNENFEWNNKQIENKKGTVYKIGYILWYLLLCLCSPRRDYKDDRMICVTGPINEKILTGIVDCADCFRFAKLSSSLSSIKNNLSVLSPYSYRKRIAITCQAIRFYRRHINELKGYFHFTLEYFSIANFIENKEIKEIYLPCIYERYGTFLSYYTYSREIKLISIQDGAAIDIRIPNKIYTTEVYCFDEFEENIIKNFIANDDCEYKHMGFVSMLQWEKIRCEKKYVIGVASQDWFTSKTIDLLEELLSILSKEKYVIVLFPHYRESESTYRHVKEKYPDLVIKTGPRYSNIDVLITFYSTIVYDFWSVNKDIKIKCLRIPGYEPAYYCRENVVVYDDMKQLAKDILLGE